MSTIKTDLRTAATDDQGNVDLYGKQAFAGVFKLGLILGSQDPDSKQFPTDKKGLQDMKEQLETTTFYCLSGLAGIGAIIGAADPAALTKDDLGNIGSAISSLSLLGMEAQDHMKNIEIDLRKRAECLPNQEQESSLEADKVTSLIKVMVADGCLLSFQKEWAEGLGRSNFPELVRYFETMQPKRKSDG